MDNLYNCHSVNPDGIGLAWLNRDRTKVKFVKGIQYIEVLGRLEKIEANKTPYILHFRFATIGEKQDRLCHPFPITTDKKLLFSLRGDAPAVLAHNGTWRSWPTVFTEEAVERLEKQGWSDSSIIAWLIGKGCQVELPQYGYGHRIATLSASKGLKLFGDWWEDTQTGISYSNQHWKNTTKYGDSCTVRGAGVTTTTTRRGKVTVTTSIPAGNNGGVAGNEAGNKASPTSTDRVRWRWPH